ncbi:hypothetical protein OJ997_16065 [Solirubrobacter phytolaccae]|uniref:Uncharacterized protein n=1 Tax=Solirubrobacter phytolaccae TaxID=1404360 RepID=A0A9X3S866_9ACTN|nr:hypothetical protein [Solirubrobacter phytolaccae]MDA0181819.1 hypothetical protein [Solirubrobacter phytolaccae]
MIDLTGIPALDLALGMAFVFFLLSTLAATIQELIASFLGLRARTLEQGLRSMLEDEQVGWKYVDNFYDHPLIKTLYKTARPAVLTGGDVPVAADENAVDPDPKGRRAAVAQRNFIERAVSFFGPTSGPSYISPRAFATVVLDPEKLFGQASAVASEAPGTLGERLQAVVKDSQSDVERERLRLEAWYDDTMARVSGWYKRKSQIMLLVIGTALAIGINANAIRMGERMWKDDTVRSAVVAKATALETPTGTEQATAAQDQLKRAADDVDSVVKLGIPLGWGEDAKAYPWWKTVPGWVLTILAISLGAPFWFDALGRLSRIRSSGKPETPLPATASGQANERVRT